MKNKPDDNKLDSPSYIKESSDKDSQRQERTNPTKDASEQMHRQPTVNKPVGKKPLH